MPNHKTYKVKGKLYHGIELSEGEQLILAKENNRRCSEQRKLKVVSNDNIKVS